MLTIKRKICNSVYCKNWECIAKDVEDVKTALYVIQERAKTIRSTHLKHIFGIFDGNSISPIKKIEV